MRKWHHIGICLILTVCLLLLSACKGGLTPQADDPTQTTGQNSENAANQNNEKNDATQSTGQNGDNVIKFQANTSFIRAQSGWASELSEQGGLSYGKLLTYESCKALLEKGVQTHSTCSAYCFRYSAEDGMCPYGKAVRSISYPEEFFEDHSLILLGLELGSGSMIMEVRELLYKNGTVFCMLDFPVSKEGTLYTADMAYWYCFVEVDTVLPEGTVVIPNSGQVVYEHEVYLQKREQFHNQCIE